VRLDSTRQIAARSPAKDSSVQQPVTPLLSDIAIQRELGSLPGWARRGDVLTKTFKWRTFPDSVAFVNRIADAAEAMNHHPDIDIRYNRVTCTLSTHDAGGITQKDVELAGAIELAADNAM
jgi:4a-hydroxytetrahydrobiopterin dehydratase